MLALGIRSARAVFRTSLPGQLIALALALTATSTHSLAQDGEDAAVSTYELGKIQVTAERFEQNEQDVAASLTAFDREDLSNGRIESLQQLDQHVPNLVLTTQGSPRFSINSIRGISNTVRDDYFSSTIGVYLDGVPLTEAEYSRRLVDLERVEVLRGPQGTLYGRNTPAGVINLISRTPTDVLTGEAEAIIGNNRQRGVSGFISGPISKDTVSGRLFLDYFERDGFTEYTSTGEGIDDLESLTGSGALRFTPRDDTEITLSTNIESINEGAYAFQAFDDFRRRKVDILPPNREDRDLHSVAVSARHDLGFASLRSITGYRSYEIESEQDLAYNPTIAASGGGRSDALETGDQFSQEMRLSGVSDDSALRWLGGVFYQWDEVDYDYLFDVPAFGPPSLSASTYEREELAGFAELTRTLASRLELTAGVRVSRDAHEVDNNVPFSGEDAFTLVTPKLRAAYRLDEDRMIYAMATRGARSGGFNRLSNGDRFDPEYIWSYEAGFKTQWLDRTLTLNGAVFYINWTDQQVRTFVSPGATEIVNAGESYSQGVELEAGWNPVEGLELSGFFSLTDGEYDKFINAAGMDLSGNTLVNTPKTKAGTAVQYEFPISGFPGKGWLRTGVTYTGDQFFDPENRLEQPGYALVNLSTGIQGETFSLAAFVANLFDKDYRTYGYRDFLDYDLAIAGESRLFGVTLNAKF